MASTARRKAMTRKINSDKCHPGISELFCPVQIPSQMLSYAMHHYNYSPGILSGTLKQTFKYLSIAEFYTEIHVEFFLNVRKLSQYYAKK